MPLKSRNSACCKMLFLAASLCSRAQADAIQFKYGGVITSAGADSGVSPGMRFTGSFTYDPSQPSGGYHIEGEALYDYGDRSVQGIANSSNMTLSVGDAFSYQQSQTLFLATDRIDYKGQNGLIDINSGQPVGPLTDITVGSILDSRETLRLNFSNPLAAVSVSQELPLSLNLADFPVDGLNFVPADGQDSERFSGTIDTLYQVPEPSAILLLGVVGILARRLRKTA